MSDHEEVRVAVGQLAASVLDAQDEVTALSNEELAERLLSGRWTTIEVHEAGRRLTGDKGAPKSHKELIDRSLALEFPRTAGTFLEREAGRVIPLLLATLSSETKRAGAAEEAALSWIREANTYLTRALAAEARIEKVREWATQRRLAYSAVRQECANEVAALLDTPTQHAPTEEEEET